MFKKILFTSLLISICHTSNAQNWTYLKGYLVHDAPWNGTHPDPRLTGNHGASMQFDPNFKPSVREHTAGGIKNNN